MHKYGFARFSKYSKFEHVRFVEEKRHYEVARTLTQLLPLAVSARRRLGSFCQSLIGKAPCRDF